jgi:colicin import membrane protein
MAMKSEENSALVALAELRNLEDSRKAEEERRRSAEAQARHLAALEAERREREEAERIAREEREALARAQAEADARARDEQARLHEAEMRARMEHEERLRREQMRLEAQMRISETTASPRWPYAVVPLLAAAVAIAGTLAWRSAADTERVAELAERDRRAQDEQIAAISAKLDALEDEQARLERERTELVTQLDAATSEAQREALREQQAELDAKIAANAKAQGKKPSTGKKPAPKPAKPSDGETKPSRPPIVIDDTTDPLAGLGSP